MDNTHRFTPRNRTAAIAAGLCLSATALVSTSAAHADCTAAEQRQLAVNDAWLEGRIETVYALNRHLNPFTIDPEVNCGAVTLFGTVESDIDRDLAGELATNVDGVTEVDNKLLIDGKRSTTAKAIDKTKSAAKSFAQRVEDATTTALVKSRLLLNKHTDGLDINVDTHHGVVTLSGRVSNDQKRELAAQIAESTDGVSDVENRLRLRNS